MLQGNLLRSVSGWTIVRVNYSQSNTLTSNTCDCSVYQVNKCVLYKVTYKQNLLAWIKTDASDEFQRRHVKFFADTQYAG